MDDWGLLWYYIKTGQITMWKPDKRLRFLGFKRTYYDGHIFAFGFWFFTVGLSNFKDQRIRTMMWAYVDFVDTLIKG